MLVGHCVIMRENTLGSKALKKRNGTELLATRLADKQREKGGYIKVMVTNLTIVTLTLETTPNLTWQWFRGELTGQKKKIPGVGGVAEIGVAGDYE